MSDPVEITQQVTTHGQQAGAAVTAVGTLAIVIGAFAKLWAVIFGTPKDRAEATALEASASERAAEIALRAAEHSEERAERADENTARHAHALGTCEEQLRVMREQSARERAEDRARIAALESGLAEHVSCGPRIKALEDDVALSKRMLADYMGNTPQHGIHPDEVRAEMARQET